MIESMAQCSTPVQPGAMTGNTDDVVSVLAPVYVTLPDPEFVSWLNSNGFSGCMNGNQLDITCSTVLNTTILHIQSTNITDLTGLEYFTNVTELWCKENSSLI